MAVSLLEHWTLSSGLILCYLRMCAIDSLRRLAVHNVCMHVVPADHFKIVVPFVSSYAHTNFKKVLKASPTVTLCKTIITCTIDLSK